MGFQILPQRTPVSDDEMIRALEREAATLSQRGKTVKASEARRLASTLRQTLKDHKASLDEVMRAEERTKAGGDGLADAKATMQVRWAMVMDSQERARRFLDTPR